MCYYLSVARDNATAGPRPLVGVLQAGVELLTNLFTWPKHSALLSVVMCSHAKSDFIADIVLNYTQRVVVGVGGGTNHSLDFNRIQKRVKWLVVTRAVQTGSIEYNECKLIDQFKRRKNNKDLLPWR